MLLLWNSRQMRGGGTRLVVALLALLINSDCHALTQRAMEGGSVVLKCQPPPSSDSPTNSSPDSTATAAIVAGASQVPSSSSSSSSASLPPGNIAWLRNGHLVANTSRTMQVGAELRINVARRTDDGQYECRRHAENDATTVLSSMLLQIVWIESANVRRERPHIESPGYLTLICHTEAFGPTHIAWLKDGRPFEAGAAVADQPAGNQLFFSHPGAAEDGVYACTARNEAGRVVSRRNFTMNAAVRAEHANAAVAASAEGAKHGGKVSKKLMAMRSKRGGAQEHGAAHEVQAKENEPAWLACEVGGKKKQQQQQQANSVGHSVKWLKDGKLLRHTELVGAHAASASTTEATFSENGRPREDSRIVVNTRNATLHLTAVFASDSGLYECHIYNDQEVQIAHKRSTLRVIEQLRFVPQPTSKNIELGSVAKVHCKVQGTPTPTVKWTKNGADLPAEAAIEDINGTLVFRNVSAADRGNYTCSASSTQGEITADITIGVVVAPRFVLAPLGPVLQATEQASVWLHCQATGDPMPTIQWDKDLVSLSSAAAVAADNNTTTTSRYQVLPNGTLHIMDVHAEDEGQYGCTIGSSAGLKREEVRMTVRLLDEYVADEPGDGFMITRAVLITMSVAFAYIILVVGLMLWCRFRRQARKARLNLLDKDAIENGGTGGNGDLKLCEIEPCLPADKAKKMNGHAKQRLDGGATAAAMAAESNNDTAASSNSKLSKKSSNFENITVPRASLVDLVLVGQGDFGEVFVGKMRARDVRADVDAKGAGAELTVPSSGDEKTKSKQSLNEISEMREASATTTTAAAEGSTAAAADDDATRDVLVKALNRVKDESVCIEFRRQIDMFRAVSHRSVCKLFGLVRDKDPHLLVLEHTDLGDLKQYLGRPRNGSAHPVTPPSTVQLLQIAWQIGRGMDAIYRARYIHKDLAARNCLINSALDVKISYGGLSRAEGGSGEYAAEYARHNNALVPLRWMAAECLHDDDYSTKSDVYAFGVLVWELFSAGVATLPLADLNDETFVQRLRDGTLERALATGTPVELHAVLTSCWNSNPKERPSFHTLHTAIANCLQTEKAKETATASPK